jgi:hypothetical protein
VTPDEFVAWLKSVKLTAPFVVPDDARDLRNMIKSAMPDASVEVALLGARSDRVCVMVKRGDVTIARTIDVV